MSENTIRLPVGSIFAGEHDVFVLREDGDLWLQSGVLDDAAPEAVRVVDLDDPRVELPDGSGANRVESVVGPVRGVVYFTDCCEPASGNVYAVGESGGTRVLLVPGRRVALRPDRGALATVNRYAMSVIDLSSQRAVTKTFSDPASQIEGELDLLWIADGRSIVLLDAAPDRFRLMRVSATPPFDVEASVDVSTVPRSVSSWLRFAGRGPKGEIVVAVRDSDATRLRFFDPRSLVEVSGSPRRIEGPISSVRLGPDGASALWVAGGVLSYQQADGALRSTGPGIADAWFAGG